MEAVTQEEIVGDFWDFLHDGAYLCRLINKLEPGAVPDKMEKPTSQPFKQVALHDHGNISKSLGESHPVPARALLTYENFKKTESLEVPIRP